MRHVRNWILFLLLAAGTGCSLYSRSSLYEIARAALEKDAQLPPNARIASAKDADYFIGQSAACVQIPYDVTDQSGSQKRGACLVWLNRICIRWEVDRCVHATTFPLPR